MLVCLTRIQLQEMISLGHFQYFSPLTVTGMNGSRFCNVMIWKGIVDLSGVGSHATDVHLELSVLSPGNDLQLVSATHLRSESVHSDLSWK